MIRGDQMINIGSIQIHKHVFAEIISSAIEEVEGARLADEHFKTKLYELFGQRTYPAVVVKIDESHEVSLEVKVVIRYGLNVQDIAHQLQKIFKRAIEQTVDVNLKEININVQGIERGQK